MNTFAAYPEISVSENCTVRFFDRSSVYFGDYHHVKLEARCELELPESYDTLSDRHLCDKSLPNTALYIRVLERMAVPSESVEDVKIALIEDFRINSLPYLSTPDFSLKMILRNVPAKSCVKRKYPASSG